MKFLSVVELIFILNNFFGFLCEGCPRWRASYINRAGVEKLWTFIKNRKLLNIGST